MTNYAEILAKIANRIMDCRHERDIAKCNHCINFSSCPLTNQLRKYEIMEQRQNEHLLGYK